MPWPRLWSSSTDDKNAKDASLGERVEDVVRDIVPGSERQQHERDSQTSSVLHSFAEPQTLLATAVLTTAILGSYRFYRSYLRRIPEATNIHASFFRQRSVFGKVTSVGDGDNFRLYHTPGGILSGWGWLPGRRVPTDKKDLKKQTIHIRIAGIDAPELAHFGKPAQPFSQDALQWLTSYVLGRRVRAYLHRPDQYSRVVATVYVRKGLLRRDVGLQMLRSGLAAVYEAKTGVEFGEGLEQKYRSAEAWARSRKKGMWSGDAATYESPREYKTRHAIGKD